MVSSIGPSLTRDEAWKVWRAAFQTGAAMAVNMVDVLDNGAPQESDEEVLRIADLTGRGLSEHTPARLFALWWSERQREGGGA